MTRSSNHRASVRLMLLAEAVSFHMIAEDLKNRIDGLTAEERHELSAYLTKLELENDHEYWQTIRRRVAGTESGRLVSVDEL